MAKIRFDHRGQQAGGNRMGEEPRRPGGQALAVNGRATPLGWSNLTRPILTQDQRFLKILNLIPIYARTEFPVLITGEPGTGKDLVAEAIWALSNRAQKPLIKLNCAALVESVANSELFGHVRGAFTDAHRTRQGKFALAHLGTLFLDEVGDLPLAVQPKLLRAVEFGEIEPVGSETMLQVNVRLIAATNQDLRSFLQRGQFRRDLYDRLATLSLHLPPLRERPADILLLANYFATQTAQEYGFGPVYLSSQVEKALLQYHWPGNVRELRNVITRAVLLREDVAITAVDLEEEMPRSALVSAPLEAGGVATLPTRPPRQELLERLRQEQGNVSALSRQLGVCTKTIYRWLKHYQIELDQFRQVSGY